MSDPTPAVLLPAQRRALYTALLAAFPAPGDLARLTRLRLDLNLAEIAEPTALRDEVTALIEWAEAQGQVRELITAALADNPGNPQLRDVAASVGVAVPALPPIPARGA